METQIPIQIPTQWQNIYIRDSTEKYNQRYNIFVGGNNPVSVFIKKKELIFPVIELIEKCLCSPVYFPIRLKIFSQCHK